ncbi:MAG: hypothetical protein AB7O45_07385, partial [Alphaproteobacteria bacterium]
GSSPYYYGPSYYGSGYRSYDHRYDRRDHDGWRGNDRRDPPPVVHNDPPRRNPPPRPQPPRGYSGGADERAAERFNRERSRSGPMPGE